MGIFVVLILAALLLPYIFFLITLQAAFAAIPEPQRKMAPGLVWLNLIPVFSLIWNFFIVINLSESYKQAYAARNTAAPGDCGFALGLAYAILPLTLWIPVLDILCALGLFIVWIIYWSKVASMKNAYLALPATP